MDRIRKTLAKIKPGNLDSMNKTKALWDKLGKPLGSLGRLEEMAIKLAGMRGRIDNKLPKKAIIVMASDNGIYEEGISSSPQEFTRILAENTAGGITGVATMARYVDSEVHVVDMGIIGELDRENIINRKISPGTNNFLEDKAMTYEEAIKSVEIGIEIADELIRKYEYDILGVGELGIGNTTTSTAVLSGLTGLPVDKTCGIGGGLRKDQFNHKIKVITEGLKKHRPRKNDPIDVISKVGGYDIGGMCGVYLSAAKNRVPIVMDGFISQVGALCAVRMKPEVKDYLLPSHLSMEAGASHAFKELGMEAILNLEMRLGEGSGCPLVFQIIDMISYIQNNMGTFNDLNIDSSILLDMRGKDYINK